jgi:hypothetical protein
LVKASIAEYANRIDPIIFSRNVYAKLSGIDLRELLNICFLKSFERV